MQHWKGETADSIKLDTDPSPSNRFWKKTPWMFNGYAAFPTSSFLSLSSHLCSTFSQCSSGIHSPSQPPFHSSPSRRSQGQRTPRAPMEGQSENAEGYLLITSASLTSSPGHCCYFCCVGCEEHWTQPMSSINWIPIKWGAQAEFRRE